MPRITGEVTKNINFRRLANLLEKASADIVEKSAGIVVEDIERGIEYGRDIEGKPFKPLKPSTVQSKRARGSGSPRKPLKNTGTMQKVYIKKRPTPSNPRAVIIAAKKRAEIGKFHQEGIKPHTIEAGPGKVLPIYTTKGALIFRKRAKHPGTPPRRWFGISPSAMRSIDKTSNRKIAQVLRRA